MPEYTRFEPNFKEGLTDGQVKQRIDSNLVNHDTTVPTKSVKRILYENFFTLFNLLNLALAIAIFAVGSYKNMLFLFIVIINTAISTIQEIHSKRVVDKLSLMATSKVNVIRNSKKQNISIYELVLDDIVEFHTGNQIPTDSIIQDGEVLVNESFITGEPDSITKKKGDTILSGSYIISGKCLAKVEHIGTDNYTAKISSGAKYIKKVKSEIMTSLNKIIKVLTFVIIPIGACMFYSQLNIDGISIQDAVVQSAASIIGMIPEGLVLLTSTVLAISVIRLSKSKVLVQDLYCIETLARVDTLCLDKTGTLTEGSMEVKDFICVNTNKDEMENILANISKFSIDENSTIMAIKDYFSNISNEFEPINIISFSSLKKWSGIYFKDKGSYIIGAPEFVLKDDFEKYRKEVEKYSVDYRVLVLAHSKNDFNKKDLPDKVNLLGYILLLDKIRPDANETLSYFEAQGVDIKIISGDNPVTVSKIAKNVGVKNYDRYIDMSTISEDTDLNDIAINYTIFGRVSPTQKQSLIKSLKSNDRTVAMTGDGVNDVLALKEADCSVAMASGSDATKNISQLVLLDSNFAAMPKIVAEGRRTINNIQRSASLFLVKTIYSTIFALMFLFMAEQYPFEPIQLSLISVTTIGIPSFMLALEPNKERIRGNFLRNVIAKAFPTAITNVITIFALTILNKLGFIAEEYFSSLCVISTGISGLALLFTLTRSRKSENSKLPFSIYRLVLAICMTVLFILGLTIGSKLFSIVDLNVIRDYVFDIFVIVVFNFIILNWLFNKIMRINK